MKKFILMIVALSLLSPAYAQGRGGKQVKQKGKVGKVFKEQNIESRKVVGFAKDISRVELTTRISADLIKVGFHDGDLVKKGQMLYQFRSGGQECGGEACRSQGAPYLCGEQL